jgi:SET domain
MAKKRTTTATAAAVKTNDRKRGRDGDGGDYKANNSTNSKTDDKHVVPASLLSSLSWSSSSSSSSGSQQLTAGGVIILMIAIVAGVLLNKQNVQQIDPTLRSFWPVVCSHSANGAAVCDRSIRPTRRTLEASHPILPDKTLVEIPRHMQIWEVDALRSDIMTLGDSGDKTLFAARHEMSQNKLAGGAYLAAYLAWEQRRLLSSEEEDDDTNSTTPTTTAAAAATSEMDDVTKFRCAYLNALPTIDELSDHPIKMNRHDLKTLLGHHSWTYAVVVMMQEMVTSEYLAFVNVSSTFGSTISRQDYEVARIHVLSRSFNPGPDACKHDVSDKEREMWTSKLLKNDSTQEKMFEYGCHAMVPILDSLNHHPQPNVVYNYDSTKKAFVISAKTKIQVGWELMDSYGKFSDAHLFARYGFVLGDGSGHTHASIAVFHRPLDVGLGDEFSLVPVATRQLDDLTVVPDFQKRDLKRYLQYDDGYHDCISKKNNPTAYELKRWKWKHLARIANDPDRWTVTLNPRSPKSKPAESSDQLIVELPPKLDPRSNLRMDMTSLVETCRLLALTTNDYDGNALQVLKDNVGNATFVVAQGNEALEYRALMFLGRLASTALMQYQTTVQAEYDRVVEFNREAFPDRNWTAGHLRLGEMQSLQALSGIAFGHARKWDDKAKADTTGAYKIREKSCNKDYTDEMDKDEE